LRKLLSRERHGPEDGVSPPQRLLRPLALGDVAGGGVDRVFLHNRDGLPLQPDLGAILAEVAVLEVSCQHATTQTLQFTRGRRAVLGVNELDKRSREQFFAGVAECPLEGRVHALEASIQTRDAEQVGRELEQAVPLLLGPPALPPSLCLL
jgi:hypothetical protein